MSKRYPRRFASDSEGYYIEVPSSGASGILIGPVSRHSFSRMAEKWLEEHRVETFDHLPKEPNSEPELDRLRNDVASLGILKDDAERNYHESAITEARKQERLSCSSELWQEAQRLRRAGMLNDAYEYEQAAKLIAKDDFPKGLTQ